MLFKILFTIVFFTIIVYLTKKYVYRRKLRKRVMADGTTDYSSTAVNIAQSIANSKALYKELITKTHPDRYTNDLEKQGKASELSSLITEAKRNYSKLIELRERVNNEL